MLEAGFINLYGLFLLTAGDRPEGILNQIGIF
jgi:hypothetical protein